MPKHKAKRIKMLKKEHERKERRQETKKKLTIQRKEQREWAKKKETASLLTMASMLALEGEDIIRKAENYNK